MIFDLYGTLIDIHTDEGTPALWQSMADHYRSHGAHYTPNELRDSYFALVHELEADTKQLRQDAHEAHPEIQLEQVFAALFHSKGVTADAALIQKTGGRFRACSTEYLRLYDGVVELLEGLRRSGVRVWLLSNAQRMFTEYELNTVGLTGYFDGIYLSSDYGCKKPDSKFFQILLEEQHIAPKTAVMVGNDGVCDIQGARAVGLSAIYLRSNLSPKESVPEADHVLMEPDLHKLKRLLLD